MKSDYIKVILGVAILFCAWMLFRILLVKGVLSHSF